MTAARERFAGVLSILQYNRHYYIASVSALVAIGAILWLRLLPRVSDVLLMAAAALTGFWSLSSLLASWYIYDCAGVTRWNWLPQTLSSPPRQWLNIHAGLDESTPALTRFFPDTAYEVLDIYDVREMTEPSIARARQLHPAVHSADVARLDALPFPDRDRDTMFVLFAAHEIRSPARRRQFFVEAARVLAVPGQLLLVEHLRDWKNFVAFGPGFLHFYSRTEWYRVMRDAGFIVVREDCVTPFVRAFLLVRENV